jgi:hypothetical protein
VTGALQWLIPQPTRVRVPTPRPSKHTYSTSARQLNAERCAAAYLYSFDYFLSANLFRFTLRTGLLLVVLSLPEKPIGLRRYQFAVKQWYLVTTDSRIFNTVRNLYLLRSTERSATKQLFCSLTPARAYKGGRGDRLKIFVYHPSVNPRISLH